jgi:hypothetical protein
MDFIFIRPVIFAARGVKWRVNTFTWGHPPITAVHRVERQQGGVIQEIWGTSQWWPRIAASC